MNGKLQMYMLLTKVNKFSGSMPTTMNYLKSLHLASAYGGQVCASQFEHALEFNNYLAKINCVKFVKEVSRLELIGPTQKR